jgi:hypothetical protein
MPIIHKFQGSTKHLKATGQLDQTSILIAKSDFFGFPYADVGRKRIAPRFKIWKQRNFKKSYATEKWC